MRWIATFGLMLLLFGSSSGCVHGHRRGRTVRLWADVNTLGKPAIFFETQKRGPYSNKTVNHFRWMYGRDTHVAVMNTGLPVEELTTETEPESNEEARLTPDPVEPAELPPNVEDAPIPEPFQETPMVPETPSDSSTEEPESTPPPPFADEEDNTQPVPPVFQLETPEEPLNAPPAEKSAEPSTLPNPLFTPDGPTAQTPSPITHSVFQSHGEGPRLIAPQHFERSQPARKPPRIQLLTPEVINKGRMGRKFQPVVIVITTVMFLS